MHTRYDLGKTGEDGDGLDAIWGPKTQAAWDKFKKESSPTPIGTNDLLGALATAADRSQLSITADQVNNLIVTKETDKLIALNKIDIDINEALDLAGTKPFGFTKFNPGPGYGGHCIPLDPFYRSNTFEFS